MKHRFSYRLFMNYIDLAEAPALVRAGLLAEGLFAQNSFRRQDHFGDPRESLEQTVRDLVLKETGRPAAGPIRLLTLLRVYGCYFNPLSLYFCFAADGATLETIVVEVENTPWLERHCYVLGAGNRAPGAKREHRHRKSFHVSPFMGMNVEYRWRLSTPGEKLRVCIENRRLTEQPDPQHGEVVEQRCYFRAAMSLRRWPLNRRTQRTLHGRHPLAPAQVVVGIYQQAYHLWRKQCPYYPHPKRLAETALLSEKSANRGSPHIRPSSANNPEVSEPERSLASSGAD